MRAGYRAEGSKLSVAESATETYDEAIGVELDLLRLTGEERHLEAAFRYAEKSKAGVLRDALNEAEARSFAGIPAALLDEERRLRGDLAAADRRLTEAQLEAGGRGAAAGPAGELFALKRDYEALQRGSRRSTPTTTISSTASRPRTRGDPAGALDEGSVLVEYFLGSERVHIFTITAESLEVASVPREAVARSRRPQLRRAISARN